MPKDFAIPNYELNPDKPQMQIEFVADNDEGKGFRFWVVCVRECGSDVITVTRKPTKMTSEEVVDSSMDGDQDTTDTTSVDTGGTANPEKGIRDYCGPYGFVVDILSQI